MGEGSGKRALGLLLVLAGLGSCDERSRTPVMPSEVPTFTLSATGVSPASLTIALGDRVLFVNDDSRPHVIVSDPHPDESDCPAINQVGFLQPGQRRETGNFVQLDHCGFHDREAPASRAYAGAIVIE